LRRFLDRRLADYPAARDRLAEPGGSGLSASLHFGELSARQAWHAAAARPQSLPFLRQLAWREFGAHLLWHLPGLAEHALKPGFDRLAWRREPGLLKAWTSGRTGYGVVDAGLRELAATGGMHNRARMVAAGFLVKDLLLDWRQGARHFWDRLVDADLASNTFNWQWAAGCGADAAPFFRVFNPALQARRFDPQGRYVGRWAPQARPPLVDHAQARQRALAIWKTLA
jgi:deoxyribodipyrimidine photo-lyase